MSREREALEKTELEFIFPAHANPSQMLLLSSASLPLYYFSLSAMAICAAKSGSVLFFWLRRAALIRSLERESFRVPVYTWAFVSV